MTYLQNDNGDVINTEDFTISKQIFSVLDLTIKGDASEGFKVDNNSFNRKALGIHSVMQLNSPAFSPIPFTLYRDGNKISTGKVIIQSIGDQFQGYYISGNSNWFNDFDFSIKDLDYRKYNKIGQKWGDTWYSNTATDGIVYPHVDFMFDNKKYSVWFNWIIYPDASDHILNVCELWPCFYLKSVVETIFRTSKYKYDGDLLNDYKYQNAVITPDSGEMQLTDKFINDHTAIGTVSGQDVTGGVSTTILLTSTDFYWSGNGYNPNAYYGVDAVVEIITNTSQLYTLSGGLTLSYISDSRIYAKIPGYSSPGTPLTVNILGASNFTIIMGKITFSPTKQLNPYLAYVQGNYILPDMNAQEVIKMLCLRFGCLLSYNENGKILSFNKIENITDVEDWSQYIQSYEFIYMYGNKNNFIRMTQSDDTSEYNDSNIPGYGEVSLGGQFDVNEGTDLYTDPFGPAKDRINQSPTSSLVFTNSMNGWLMPFVPLVNFDDGDRYSVTISNNGAGYIRLSATFDTSNIFTNVVVRIDNSTVHNGYHVILEVTATYIDLFSSFSGADTGTAFIQKGSANKAGSRLLINLNNQNISFASTNAINWISEIGGSGVPSSSIKSKFNFAYFSKPKTGLFCDRLTESMSYGPLNIENYKDNPLKSDKLNNMFNAPILRAQLLLPASIANNFNFKKFIYISTKDFTGKFFVNKFFNYIDSTTLVQIDFLKVDK